MKVTRQEYRNDSRMALVAAAMSMLESDDKVLPGLRKICARFEIGDRDNPMFLPLIAMESETDRFPWGATRSAFSDARLHEYIDNVRTEIHASCLEIIAKLA